MLSGQRGWGRVTHTPPSLLPRPLCLPILASTQAQAGGAPVGRERALESAKTSGSVSCAPCHSGLTAFLVGGPCGWMNGGPTWGGRGAGPGGGGEGTEGQGTGRPCPEGFISATASPWSGGISSMEASPSFPLSSGRCQVSGNRAWPGSLTHRETVSTTLRTPQTETSPPDCLRGPQWDPPKAVKVTRCCKGQQREGACELAAVFAALLFPCHYFRARCVLT